MAFLSDPTGELHDGMPTFAYRMAPDGLATVRQLRAKGLRPGGQQIAAHILWRNGLRVAHLYRLDLALPKRTASPAQWQSTRKALLARRTCPDCRQVRDYYIPRRTGVCLTCEDLSPITNTAAGEELTHA
ncbi:RRQRL motif-containing zinc-binding protein [Actinoplanes subglobosus]|uniref:RRQRL motif-containing zinc-binding protein n=1 Tax=Actinoplanes subglobosus TaxID=1547892 RepID=A0ABV8ISF1_9ACTN